MRQGELPQNLPVIKAATPKLATPANLMCVKKLKMQPRSPYFLPVWHLIPVVPKVGVATPWGVVRQLGGVAR